MKLLTKQKTRQIEILSEGSILSKKSKTLYDGIQKGIITTDEEAAKILYNASSSLPKYRVLKNRFKQRLINTLFFTDVQAYGKSTYNRVLNRSYKNWAAAKILLDKALSKNAISIMEDVLKNSLAYDIEELSQLILRDVKMHYGLYNYNKAKFVKYNLLFDKLSVIVDYKSKAEKLYIFFGRLIETKKSIAYDSIIKKKEKELSTLSNKALNIDSYYLRYQLYMCHYIVNLIKKDLKKQLKYIQEAIEYFDTKKGFHNYGTGSFLQLSGITKLGLKQFDESLKTFKKCLALKPAEGRLFWQSTYNYIFQIHILKKEYHLAYKSLSYVINHKSFKNVYIDFRQHWYLKEAFIQFLIRIGRIDPNKIISQKLKPFRIRKFLNDTPSLSKDKRGYNTTIQIIQILYLIIDNKYDKLLDKISSLKQYSFRYLRPDEFLRARIFIKMLLIIPEQSYDIDKIKVKTKSLLQKLITTPMDFSEQAMSIEIIPYEQLWEEVIGLLER